MDWTHLLQDVTKSSRLSRAAVDFKVYDACGTQRGAVEREDLWPLDRLFYTAKEFYVRSELGGVCMIIREEG